MKKLILVLIMIGITRCSYGRPIMTGDQRAKIYEVRKECLLGECPLKGGMAPDEVIAIIGKPTRRIYSKIEIWEYHCRGIHWEVMPGGSEYADIMRLGFRNGVLLEPLGLQLSKAWVKPGGNPEELKKDYSECKQQDSPKNIASCMEAKGYQWK
jgi:hypothetical protein